MKVCSSYGRESAKKSIAMASHISQEDICMIYVGKLPFQVYLDKIYDQDGGQILQKM